MTWVVGGSMIWYSYLIADVRVSFEHHEPLDCLQKIHILRDDMVCGFAGGVIPCLHLVEHLKKQICHIELGSKKASGKLFYNTIPTLLRNEYGRIANKHSGQYANVSIVILSRWTGAKVESRFGQFPLVKMFTYRHPKFEAITNWKFSISDASRIVPHDSQVFLPKNQTYFVPICIGSGSTIDGVDKFLSGAAWSFSNSVVNGNSENLECVPDVLALGMRSMVERADRQDVGKLYQLGILQSSSSTEIQIVDRKYFDVDVTPIVESTLASYVAFLSANGLADARATC